MTESKVSKVREAMAAGRWEEAIRLAARFPRLGAYRAAILDAHTAFTNPRWTAGLGRSVEADIEAGRRALVDAYGRGQASAP